MVAEGHPLFQVLRQCLLARAIGEKVHGVFDIDTFAGLLPADLRGDFRLTIRYLQAAGRCISLPPPRVAAVANASARPDERAVDELALEQYRRLIAGCVNGYRADIPAFGAIAVAIAQYLLACGAADAYINYAVFVKWLTPADRALLDGFGDEGYRGVQEMIARIERIGVPPVKLLHLVSGFNMVAPRIG